jgi:2-iminobutanoate/2-iminopropanoate deaminase
MEEHKSIVKVSSAPAAIGPYSQGVRYHDLVFISGQLGIVPETGQMAGDDVVSQTRQIIINLKCIMESTGGSLYNILKTTVYLASMDDFETMNKVYEEFFNLDPPARACVEVSRLPKNARVEIEAIGHIPKPKNTGGGLLY